jgi:transaldolase/glucose-6-phosphate isomerase
VPGHSGSFGVVKARGDLEVLEERGRRALRIHLKGADAGLADLANAVKAAFV